MFKNKHVVIAMLVAPALAILAWFAVDYFVAERPHAAQPGAVYRLVAKSNCRYDSGQCDLENADFELILRPIRVRADAAMIELTSRFALQSATIAIVKDGSEQAPVQMTPADKDKFNWIGEIRTSAEAESSIRLAVVAQGATWFAEVPVTWIVSRD